MGGVSPPQESLPPRLAPIWTSRFRLPGLRGSGSGPDHAPGRHRGPVHSFQLTTSPAQPTGTVYAVNGLPAGLAITSSTGVISAPTTTVSTFNGLLSLTANSATTSYQYSIPVDPAAGAFTLTRAGSAVGTVGTPFSYALTASNGPTSSNIAHLPPGLTANGAVISGTPTTAGLSFTSIGANNAVGQGAILVVIWTMNAAGPGAGREERRVRPESP
jgi:hypothetical protein